MREGSGAIHLAAEEVEYRSGIGLAGLRPLNEG